MPFVQRFGSSINLNPHFHVLFLDGVYVPAADGGAPVFVAAPPLADEDVHEMTSRRPPSASCACSGLLDDSRSTALSESDPLQAALSAASVQGQLASWPPADHRRQLTFRLKTPWPRICCSPPVVPRRLYGPRVAALRNQAPTILVPLQLQDLTALLGPAVRHRKYLENSSKS